MNGCSAHSVVLGVESTDMPNDTPRVKGYDFNKGVNLDEMMSFFATTGFQATNIADAILEINRMRNWRLSDVDPSESGFDHSLDLKTRQQIRAKIFLGFTSNQISSGQREVIRFLVQHSMVDVIVTTAGGVEEDLIKCLNPTFIGSFKHIGRDLRKRGINRIGNLYLPNKNYCDFEDWLFPILHKMHDEQEEAWSAFSRKSSSEEDDSSRFLWTPSSFIKRLGHEINNEESVLYWAARNNIPVFCPALTDGSIGDMLYFYSYKRPGFVLDIVQDLRNINNEAIRSYATGMIILGGGVVKHHTCNANLMRNGADFAVFINTGHEFDGSDAGAAPDEAISWGKIRVNAQPVKICSEATVVFPLIVSQTFAKNVEQWKSSTQNSMCWTDESFHNG
jgi:deoxyhypusine synthase